LCSICIYILAQDSSTRGWDISFYLFVDSLSRPLPFHSNWPAQGITDTFQGLCWCGLFRSFHTNWLCAQSKDWILLTLLARLLERGELIVHSIGLIVSTWFSLPTRIIYTDRPVCCWLFKWLGCVWYQFVIHAM
jgi:hypothetical protein